MAVNWGGAASGAGSGAALGSYFGPWGTAIGGVGGGLLGLFSGGKKGDGGGGDNTSVDPMQLWDDIINKYSYKPQYTGQTEKGLYDLFNQTTGLGGGGVNAIPFDIGLPTTGLYDSLTRGIKEQYLGTPGGPEGGRIADTRAYYNNMGIPEYAANQERLGNQDLNNSLLDTAAKINESQKDRLLNVLGLGSNIGSNLYAQDLAQHRFNTGFSGAGASGDLGLQQQINSANNGALAGLSGLGTSVLNLFGNSGTAQPTTPISVNKSGGSGGLTSLLSNFGSGSGSNKTSLFK